MSLDFSRLIKGKFKPYTLFFQYEVQLGTRSLYDLGSDIHVGVKDPDGALWIGSLTGAQFQKQLKLIKQSLQDCRQQEDPNNV